MADAINPMRGSLFITFIAVAEIAIILTCLHFFPLLIGNPDISNDLEKDIVPFVYYISGIVSIHTLLWFAYLNYYMTGADGMNLYYLLASSFSILISLIALSMALIMKK